MAEQIRTKLITEEELMALDEDIRVEVIDGQLVRGDSQIMTPTGVLHNLVAGNVFRELDAIAREQRLGLVFTDGLIFILAQDEEGIRDARVPDVAFVRKGRLPSEFDLARPFPGAPDLAVEVISPGDTAKEILTKVRNYLDAGADEVWILYPDQEEVHRYVRGAGTVTIYAGDDTISAETLFPGTPLIVKRFFALPNL